MRHILRITTLVLTFAIALLSSRHADAYTIVHSSNSTGWPGTSTHLWLCPNITNGAADNKTAILDALAAWNRAPQGMRIQVYETTTACSWGNGRNEIMWVAHKADIGERPGVTSWDFDAAGNLIESDIKLASDWGFTTSEDKADIKYYAGTYRSLRGVTVHELGHFMGLGHEIDTYNIMGSDYTHVHANGSQLTWYVGEDATRGAVHLYGYYPGLQDVSVSHWHLIGNDGEYSLHGRNSITDASGAGLFYTTELGEPHYTLQRGQSYYPMATLENNGASTQTVTVRFLLSTNSTISTSDISLVSVSKTLTPDVVNESTGTRVTIPTTVAPGEYWLGVCLDPENALAEFDESNNCGYLTKARIE